MDIVKFLDITVIAAIHDLNIAASMYCDYIYVMKHGEIVTKGTPKEVLTSKIIEEIYEVQADVMEQNGVLHILYHPRRKNKMKHIAMLTCLNANCRMYGCFLPQSVL